MAQTRQWKIGVVLHSSHSMFVRMLCDLFASFSERELIPNVTVIVRSMYDMDIQHQLTLIDELVTSEHIDGLALMPLANTLVRDRINDPERENGYSGRDLQHGYCGREPHCLCWAGQHRRRDAPQRQLMGMVMQGHGQRSADSRSAQRSLCGFAALHRILGGNGGKFP